MYVSIRTVHRQPEDVYSQLLNPSTMSPLGDNNRPASVAMAPVAHPMRTLYLRYLGHLCVTCVSYLRQLPASPALSTSWPG